jgi:Aspartyl protease
LWGQGDFALTFLETETFGPDLIRIPFDLTGTLITVKAKADKVEGKFFFDTGAAGLVLNQRFFSTAKKSSTGGLANGVTGSVKLEGRTKIDTFNVEKLRAIRMQADLVDLSHLEKTKKIALVGLIGYEVFKDYELLFDYKDQVLVLFRTTGKNDSASPAWEYSPVADFPLNFVGHTAILQLGFDGKKKRSFALDSGAEQNLLSTLAGKGFLKNNFEIQGRVKLRGAGSQQVEVMNGLLRNAHLDTFKIAPMQTILANLTDINVVFDAELDGVLGYEFFSQFLVSINYKKKRLYLNRRIIP